jgi:polyisoprenoid-binding protein YceI
MELGPDQGTVKVRTGVAGSASRMGHRLVLRLGDWSALVAVDAGQPTSITFQGSLDSLEVESGKGGVTPLTVVDKQVIHRNANKALDVERYPEVTFTSTEIVMTEGTLDIAGDLTIHGVTEPLDTTLTLADGRATGSITVTQTDFGIKPYSAMLGQLKVSDDVTVELDIALPQV